MGLTVCFDALGTCFGLEVLIDAVEELLGKELREAGSGSRMVVMDWFHSAQRDYTYLSITSPPPPPISKILTLTLPRSLLFALSSTPSLAKTSLPSLTPILSKLPHLSPAPRLSEAWNLLAAHAKILVITNGAKSTTEGYIQQAGLEGLVAGVKSCDDVGVGKPLPGVYEGANTACEELGGKKGERWFVAAHMWDLAAARKAGFKTGAVLAEQPPLDKIDEWWGIWGGKPDVVGYDLEEVVKGILSSTGVA